MMKGNKKTSLNRFENRKGIRKRVFNTPRVRSIKERLSSEDLY